MNAKRACAQVIDLASHPAMRARAARSVPAAVAPDVAPREADDVAIRVAARIARRRARVEPDARDVRVLHFRPWFPLFRLWRRWRLGLPLSRRWCALAKLSAPPSSPGGVVCQLKRSPRPAGVHQWRDFFAAMTRRTRRGNRASMR
jgi:hypothetical protein